MTTRDLYTITLPDGTKEHIPVGVHPCWRTNGWCATNSEATIQDVASALARAEGELRQTQKRVEYLRGLMRRTLDAEGRRALDAIEAITTPLVEAKRALRDAQAANAPGDVITELSTYVDELEANGAQG
jgi:hypothetical protein